MIKFKQYHLAISNELIDIGIDHPRLVMLGKRETTKPWMLPDEEHNTASEIVLPQALKSNLT
jgi:hypothetical protein